MKNVEYSRGVWLLKRCKLPRVRYWLLQPASGLLGKPGLWGRLSMGLGLLALVALGPLGCAALMVWQTGIYPGARVIKNNGLQTHFLCGSPNCSLVVGTQTQLASGIASNRVVAWYQQRRIGGVIQLSWLKIDYVFGEVCSVCTASPSEYLVDSRISVVYPNPARPFSSTIHTP